MLQTSMFRKIALASLLLTGVFMCQAQSGRVEPENKQAVQAPLTNQDVIEMVKAGLSESIVIAKIGASRTKFDTGIEALKQLKEAKMPESIVTKMIEASSEKPREPVADPVPKVDKPPEKSADYIAAEKVIAMLRRLDNAVEVGTTLQNYSQLLVESKSVLDENQSKLTDETFVREVNATILDHQYASSVWTLAVNNGWSFFYSKQEPGRTLITRYGVPIKISIWTEVPVMTGLRYVWVSSRNHYNQASFSFSKMSPTPEPSPTPTPSLPSPLPSPSPTPTQ